MACPCETRTSTCRSFATISSGLYRFLAIAVLLDVKDIPQVGPLQWGRIRTTRPRLGRRCFGRFNQREIVRHARISHLAAQRRLPSQSGTVFYPPLRSGGHLYRLDFPSAPGSGPSPCNTWVCLRSPCLSVGIANVVAGAVGETRLEAAPMDALVRDTIMGINESLALCDEQLLQAAIEPRCDGRLLSVLARRPPINQTSLATSRINWWIAITMFAA